MLKKKYKYIILGGGLSGLSTAYKLSKDFGEDILIIEKDKVLGGLAKGVKNNGEILDNGSHRLQKSYIKEILDFLKNDLKLDIFEVKRLSKLRLKNDYLDYPIRSFDLFFKLNFFKSILSILESFYYKIKIKNKNSFKKLLYSRVGKYIFKEFYEPYILKVWGINPNKVSKTVVKKRFSLNPLKILKQLFLSKNDNFLYIKGGFVKIIESFEQKLKQKKVKILKNTVNYKISLDKNYIELDGKKIFYENLISTIPINNLIDISNYKEKVDLNYRGLFLVYLYLDKNPLISGETFYFPREEYIFSRVSIPKRFDKKIQKNNKYTIFTCEIPFWENKFEKDIDLIKQSFIDLQKAGLINKSFKLDYKKSFLKYEENVYPIFLIGWYKNFYKYLNKILNQYNNLYISGRQGLFLHCNIDHSMKIGFDLACYLQKNNTNKKWLCYTKKYYNFIVRD